MPTWPHRVYPFLVAIWPPVALAGANTTELLGWHELLVPALLALAAAMAGWLAAIPFTPHSQKRALVATLATLCWSFFGTIHGSLVALPGHPFGELSAAGLVVFALVGAGYLLLRRVPVPPPRAGAFGCLMAGILASMATAKVVSAGPYPHLAHVETRPRPASQAGAPAEAQPDVYLIILDSYAGRRSLAAQHGFDNTPFEHSLRVRGFHVPDAPRANYLRTYLGLASMLNWTYVQELIPQTEQFGVADQVALYPFITYNRTVERFIREGYRFAFIPSGAPYTLAHLWADWVPPLPDPLRGAFTLYWPQTTPLPLLRRVVCHVGACPESSGPGSALESARRFDAKFEALATIPTLPGPTFTFVHLLLPHEPYVYNSACEYRISPFTTDIETNEGTPTVKEAYVAQVQCLNTKLLALIDTLLVRSQPRPLIILQADHGQRYGLSQTLHLQEVPSERLDEWFDIFAAYLAPSESLLGLSDTVTPVNAIRHLLGASAHRELAALPEQSFWSTRSRPLALHEVFPGRVGAAGETGSQQRPSRAGFQPE